MTMTQYLTLGAFGDAVARRAAGPQDRIDPFPLSDPAELERRVAAADFVAVAAWRPYPDAFHALDAICHRLGTPWSLAEASGTRLTIGPLSIPGSDGGCYGCYRKRWGTHHPAPERETVLEGFYATRPDSGPKGYSPPAVQLAAAALRHHADRAGRADPAAAGSLLVVDMLTVAVLESAVLPAHGCPHCFPVDAALPVGHRFNAHLVPALKELLG